MRVHYRGSNILLVLALAFLSSTPADAEKRPLDCAPFHIDSKKSVSLAAPAATAMASCATRISNGYPIPDPSCTPGAVNPTLTLEVLSDPKFRTGCVRDNATSAERKATTYVAYGIPHPTNNKGPAQVCELDHLISLELGGADTLDNIWPQCGPDAVALRERYFKQKDAVENYLTGEVCTGGMDLAEAQKGIAADWTQYLAGALSVKHYKRCH
jgi:hypothetical protein